MAFQNHLTGCVQDWTTSTRASTVYFLQSAFTQLGIFEGAGNKTTIPNFSSSRLAALEVPHLPLAEQSADRHCSRRSCEKA